MEDGVRPSRTGIRASPSISRFKRQFVHRHDHVRKIALESSRHLGDCRSPDSGPSIVYTERAVLGEEGSDAFRISAAPRPGIPLRELPYLSEITHSDITGLVAGSSHHIWRGELLRAHGCLERRRSSALQRPRIFCDEILININEAFAHHNARTADPRCLNGPVRLFRSS